MGLLDAPPYRPVGNDDALTLRRWFTALAARNSARANVLLMGDSIVTLTRGGANEAQRIPPLLFAQLQRQYMGVTQGAGYRPAMPYNETSTWTYSSSPNPTINSYGLGRVTSILVAGSGTTATVTFFGDRFRLLGLGASTGTVSVDGGAPAALIDTSASSGVPGRIVYASAVLPLGLHTVVCTAPASGTHFYLEGIDPFNGDFPGGAPIGIGGWESANSGTEVSYLLPSGYGGTATGPSSTVPYWAQTLDTVAPDLVILEFGLNAMYGITAPARTPAQEVADWLDLVGIINAQTPGADPSILPVIMWSPSFFGATEATWKTYRTAIKNAAAANGWAKPVDIYDSAGFIDGSDPYALTTDLLHASAKGKQLIVDEIMRRIAPSSPAPAAAEPGTLPWIVDIDVFGSTANTSWNGPGYVVGHLYSGYNITQGGVQNAEISWDVMLGAGTWSITATYPKNTNQGIASVRLDGVEVGTIDQYAAVASQNNITTIAGAVVATTGKHRITLKMATRNPSNVTAYYGVLNHITLRRTA